MEIAGLNEVSMQREIGVFKMEMGEGGARERARKREKRQQSGPCTQPPLRPGQKSSQPGPSVAQVSQGSLD